MKVMKRGLLATLAVLSILVVIVGIVYADFAVQNVDGVWGWIDGAVETDTPAQDIDVIGVIGNVGIGPGGEDEMYTRSATVCAGDPDGDSAFNLWTRTTTPSFANLGTYTGCTSATSLIISRYVYDQIGGATNDRLAIQIYNRTGAAIDLSNYSIRLYTSNTASTTFALSGSLANNDVYVIVNTAAAGQTNAEDQTIGNNDGYRTVVLFKEVVAGVEGATCSNWATGPGDSPTNISPNNPGIQTPPNTDENQVRYGTVNSTCSTGVFGSQSGFGYNGFDGPISTLNVNSPFTVGTFTHYNNPISASDSIQAVPLTITVPIICNSDSTVHSFSFTPIFTLDETPNTAPCAYDLPNTEIPCPDKVTVGNSSSTHTFTCVENGENVEYTVALHGFIAGNCQNTFDPNVSVEFITDEGADTVTCVWGEITPPTADIGVTKTCQLNTSGWATSFTIVTTNYGDGAAVEPTLTDTLPAGVTYNGFTSQLTTSTGTTNSGSCTNTTGTVNCALNTLLPAPVGGFNSTWTVTLNISTTQEVTNTVNVSSISTDPVMANNTSTATCSPTAVTLTSFTASELNGTVALDWKTAFERGTQGFNIYLSQTMDGEKLKVNDKLIPSKAAPGSLRGASYTYTAGQALTGEYYFWLEEVETNGNLTQYGPAVLIIK